MTETDLGAAEEAARKLFAGPCDFIWGATSPENMPPESLNEVAFVGRSNVGKSSLVNALTGRKSWRGCRRPRAPPARSISSTLAAS